MSESTSYASFINKVTAYAEKHQLIKKESHIVVGLSGGVDSICLFFVCMNWMQRKKIKNVSVVHINHMLRGQDAIEDKQFVMGLCHKYNVACHWFDENIKDISKREKLSLEEAGRKVRYEKFLEVLKKVEGTQIAVAHHKNDNEETILLNLLRGGTVKGLRGIQAKRGNIIRPLLCVEKEEIEVFVKQLDVVWKEDYTNKEDIYTRNKLRLNILPMLKKEINPNLTDTLVENGQLFGEIHDFLTKLAKEFLEKYSHYKSDNIEQRKVSENNSTYRNSVLEIDLAPLKELDVAVARYVLLESLEQIGAGRKDITKKHIDSLLHLISSQVGKKVDLPYHIEAKVSYQSLIFKEKGKEQEKISETKKFEMKCSIFPYEVGKKIQESTYTKWFDYDTINGAITLRTRQKGDMIQVLKNHGEKKLKDFFINEKIPKEERDHILLVANGNSILWVVGHRLSEAYKVSQHTKTILQIELIEGGNKNGR